MKLYTEEELLKAMQYARDYYDGWIMTEPEILKQLTPIELPSDEEIVKILYHHSDEYAAGYYGAINMIKEQIQGGNK